MVNFPNLNEQSPEVDHDFSKSDTRFSGTYPVKINPSNPPGLLAWSKKINLEHT